MKLLKTIYEKIEEPLSEVLSHFVTTAAWLVAIFLTNVIMHFLALDVSKIPFTEVRLEDWITVMDVVAITIVLGHGLWASLRGKDA